jgi:hypothetical protein
MKGYMIDEISEPDINRISEFLRENAIQSNMERLFWIDIPEECLNQTQLDHKDCQPFRFPIELGDDWIKGEFFIRTSQKFRCECNGYCDTKQRDYILNFMDRVLNELDISI